jgi:murein DD-endopeptidase MepM/ murein hydrolase activator NlpD
MTWRKIVETRGLSRSAFALVVPILLAACQTSAPRDTTYAWNLATDPPEQGRPGYAPPDRSPAYVAPERGPAYAPPGRVEVRPLDQPGPHKKSAHAWDKQSSNDRATLQTASVDAGTVAFAWPLRGHVLSEFGSKLSGERNDGINISAGFGAPIHAAANGTVSYAGSELKGYGNLILIRHADGYVTAYAHARNLIVARGDVVSQGQVIGYAGDTGGTTEPQLHFEIRHGTTPVNPRSLLAEPREQI